MDYNILAVDFDGTLCENQYPNIGAPNNLVIDYILNKKKSGDKIILWTCRVGDELNAAIKWCANHGIIFDAINENLPEVIEMYGGSDSRKIFADEYIDDKLLNIPNKWYNPQYILSVPMPDENKMNIGIYGFIWVVLFILMLIGYAHLSSRIDRIQAMTETVKEVCIYTTIPPNDEINPPIAENSILSEELMPEIFAKQNINENFDILKPCGYSAEELTYAVDDEYRNDMVKYVDIIVKAEEQYSINALYLMCKLGLESGWGRYTSGENNLGGWTNSDGSYMDFDSGENCILYIAEKLSTEYANISGTKLSDVCERYCPYDGYTDTLIEIMESRKEKIEEM